METPPDDVVEITAVPAGPPQDAPPVPLPPPPPQAVPVGRSAKYPNLIRYPKGRPNPNLVGASKKHRRAIVDFLDEELAELAEREGMDRKDAGKLIAKKWLHHIFKGNDKTMLLEYLLRRDGAVAVKVKQEIDVIEKRLSHLFTALVGANGGGEDGASERDPEQIEGGGGDEPGEEPRETEAEVKEAAPAPRPAGAMAEYAEGEEEDEDEEDEDDDDDV